MSPWVLLSLAIIFEIAGTTLLKLSDGFQRPWIALASIAAYALCFWPLALAIVKIPVGVAYAIWSAVGILAIALIGWIGYKQTLSSTQIGFILLILIGVVGLNLSTPGEATTSSQQNSA